MPFSSSYAKSFLKRLPNIDFSKDVVLRGYDILDKEKGRIKYYLVPRQDGKIESAYTKENPNGFPDMQKIKVKGKDVWDDTDQLEFLRDLINKTHFQGLPGEEAEEAPQEPAEDENGFPEAAEADF